MTSADVERALCSHERHNQGDHDLDCEFPFLYGLGTGVIVTLALVVLLRYLYPSC